MTSAEAPATVKIEPPHPEAPAPAPVPEKAPPEIKAVATHAPPSNYFGVVNVVLRFLLFASSLVAVVVMVTSKQTELVPILFPPFRAPVIAKFNHSPALV